MDEWISTGKAARIAGYDPGYFRRKFWVLLSAEGSARKIDTGHRRWHLPTIKRMWPETEKQDYKKTG